MVIFLFLVAIMDVILSFIVPAFFGKKEPAVVDMAAIFDAGL
jgi:hypothetical protein